VQKSAAVSCSERKPDGGIFAEKIFLPALQRAQILRTNFTSKTFAHARRRSARSGRRTSCAIKGRTLWSCAGKNKKPKSRAGNGRQGLRQQKNSPARCSIKQRMYMRILHIKLLAKNVAPARHK